MKSFPRSPTLRYGLAVLVVALFTLLHMVAETYIGATGPLGFYVPAIAAIAWFGGRGAAIFATALVTVVGARLFFQPLHVLLPSTGAAARIAVFWISSLFVTHIIVSLENTRRMLGELVRTARDARQSHETTLASIGDGVIATDLEERVVFMNPVAEGLTGWTFARAAGRPVADVVTLDLPDETAEQAAPQRAAVAMLRARDGTARPVLRSVSPIRDAGGSATGAVLVLRDGSEALAQEQIDALLRAIVASTSDAIIGVSDDGRVTSWNDGARRLYGYGADVSLGGEVAILVPVEYRAALRAMFEAARQGERVTDHDLVGISREGRRFDASVSIASLKVGSGLSMTVRDIGARRSGERRVRQVGAQLVRRAQELQTLFDVAPVALAIAEDAECRFVRPNLALAQLLGIEPTDNVRLVSSPGAPLPYRVLTRGRDLRDDESPLLLAVARGAALEPLEIEFAWPERRVIVLAHAAPVLDQDGRAVGCIGVFVDITDMKRAHAERDALLSEAIDARRVAEEASRLKEEFLATVSHELRTPLNAIYGWLEIMQRKPDEATRQRGLEVIRRNVRAQTRVIDDILDVSAIVTGKARLEVQPVELTGVVEAVYESLRPTADAKGVALSLRMEAGGAPLSGDPDRLQQVIWNLLSNAIKFTPADGLVTLSVGRVGATVRVRVTDTGEGIAADFLPYVFDRFRQADSSIERRHAGLGLGLAIVRHLVELHGGTVGASSDGPGRGATFTVALPLRLEADAASVADTALQHLRGAEHSFIGRA